MRCPNFGLPRICPAFGLFLHRGAHGLNIDIFLPNYTAGKPYMSSICQSLQHLNWTICSGDMAMGAPPPLSKTWWMLAIRISVPCWRLRCQLGAKRGGAASKIADLGLKGTPRPISAYVIGKLRHCSIICGNFINLGQNLGHLRSGSFVGSVLKKMWFSPHIWWSSYNLKNCKFWI